MQICENTQSENDSSETPAKAAYIKPSLKIFGSVSMLTMGGGASTADGVNSTMMA